MALDFGTKRVGVASTDESGTFAIPRLVLENDSELLEKVLDFKLKEGVDKIIMGESKNLDGTPNSIMKDIEEFKKALEERGVEVVLHPEVYTTAEAIRLQGENLMTDASAASVILKSFIDSGYNS